MIKQTIPQEEVWRTIISDMGKKRNSIVPVIGEDTYSFVPLVLLCLSYGASERVHSAFLDEPSGRSNSGRLFPNGLKKAERKEGLKVMRRYTLLTDISALAHEAGLVAPRMYI